ncbi:hypothetical protein [Microbacterium atlanticum]|uniref:hypothetical protein n=1 Tax=Microbacterium atlanticum TaxID=2782168 RepID=UPI001888E2ED|nr:hypothetical protein [Microbacterium atlanticum]
MTTCFVIGPIGNEFAPPESAARLSWESSLEIYERVIRAACEFLGIEAVRADQISISGDINEQIFRHLFEADLVIADLTGANANVMYELGLRHSLKRLTIQVADSATPLPFDVKAVRTILIERSQLGLVEARKRLVKAIETGLNGQIDMVAATRVWEALQSADSGDVTVVLGEPDPSEDEAPETQAGFFEIVMSLDDSFGTVTATLQRVSEVMSAMNEDTSLASSGLRAIPSTASNATRLAKIREFADMLKGHASEFDRVTLAYERDLSALDSHVSPLLRIVATNPTLLRNEGTTKFLEVISDLAITARQAFEGFGGFSASLQDLGAMSSMLRAPAKTIAQGVARLAETVTLIDDWDAAVRRIRDGQHQGIG